MMGQPSGPKCLAMLAWNRVRRSCASGIVTVSPFFDPFLPPFLILIDFFFLLKCGGDGDGIWQSHAFAIAIALRLPHRTDAPAIPARARFSNNSTVCVSSCSIRLCFQLSSKKLLS